MTCSETISIGAYVLGALDPQERIEADRHLGGCPACREELLKLAHLPGLLQRLTVDDVTLANPEPDIDTTLPPVAPAPLPATAFAIGEPTLSPSARRRRFTRTRLAAAAALAVLGLAGVLIGRQFLTDPPPPVGAPVTWSASGADSGVDTTAQLQSQPWGTDIRLSLRGLAPGQRCRLVVHARNGVAETAGWWATGYATGANVPASTSIRLRDIDRVQVVRAPDNAILATLTETSR